MKVGAEHIDARLEQRANQIGAAKAGTPVAKTRIFSPPCEAF